MDTSDDKVSPIIGESSPKHTFLNKQKNKKIKKILLPFIVMAAALPVIVFAALQQQETRNFAQVSNVTPTPTPSSITFGKSMKLNGIDSCAEVTDPTTKLDYASAQASKQSTIEGWFKLDDQIRTDATTYYVVSRESTVNWPSMDLSIRYGKLNFSVATTDNSNNQTTIVGVAVGKDYIQPNKWYHFAGVRDNNTINLYINGIRVGDPVTMTPSTNLPNDGSLNFGCKKDSRIGTSNYTNFFKGQIDEVRISNILRYRQDFKVPTVPFSADEYTMALWHMDGLKTNNDRQLVIFDSSKGNENNAIPIAKVDFVDSDIAPIPTPTPVPPQKATITAFQDAFVRSDQPNNNLGYAIRLRSDGTPKVISYLKFDLSPVLGKKIVSAKLILKVSNDSGAASLDTFNLRQITPSSWSEGQVTYNNRPTLGSILTTFKGKVEGETIDVDVKNFLGTSNRVSFAIATEGTNELILNSREAGSGNPQLIIEYQ